MEIKVLTPLQERILLSMFEHGLGRRGFYLTGGTALAEFYLQHRYSDDLDCFTRKVEPLQGDFLALTEQIKAMGLVLSERTVAADHLSLTVYEAHREDQKLRIDFARDLAGQAMLAQPKTVGQVVVDSFEDIAVNKVCTILSRGPYEPKDFVDLYFILRESTYTLEYLVSRAREKEVGFDSEDGVLAFATNLLGVKELKMLPRMIKPLTLSELSGFLAPLAEDLVERLRPKRDEPPSRKDRS